MKKYVCTVCGWVYDPAEGDPEGGIAPGTAFEDIPDDWVCPLCGVGKDDKRHYFLDNLKLHQRKRTAIAYEPDAIGRNLK